MTTPSYISGLLFTKAHKVVRSRIYDILEVYNLNPTLWAVLSAARHADGGIRQSAVAKQLGVQPPMVTILADDLIALGLIRRIAHHSDGRVKLLVATPKGITLANELETILDRDIHAVLAGISASDIVTFQKVLQTIIANAE